MMIDDPRTYAIVGEAMEVHNQLGCGFLEAVYQDAFEVELSSGQSRIGGMLRSRSAIRAVL